MYIREAMGQGLFQSLCWDYLGLGGSEVGNDTHIRHGFNPSAGIIWGWVLRLLLVVVRGLMVSIPLLGLFGVGSVVTRGVTGDGDKFQSLCWDYLGLGRKTWLR